MSFTRKIYFRCAHFGTRKRDTREGLETWVEERVVTTIHCVSAPFGSVEHVCNVLPALQTEMPNCR